MTDFLRDSVTDELEIIDILKAISNTKEKLWIWQENKENPNQRSIHLCTIRKVDVLGKLVWLGPLNQSQFSFNESSSDFFLFSKIKNMAIRIQAREKLPDLISFPLPSKLNALSEGFAEKLNLVEKENEKENQHLRQLPRKQAVGKQTIQGQIQGENHQRIFNLYDISAGGLAIKWDDPGHFKKDDIITIFSINESKLKNPITGQVVSVREVSKEDSGDQTDGFFKIGVKFIEKD